MFRLFYVISVLCLVIYGQSENVEYTSERGLFNKNLFQTDFKNISNSTCVSDVMGTLQSLQRKELWALKMIDAASKIQSGFALGNIFNFGSLDECLVVRGKAENRKFKGKYCVYPLFLNNILRPNITYGLPGTILDIFKESPGIPIMESICVPDSCSTQDLNDLVNHTDIIEIAQVKPYFIEKLCQVQEDTYEFTILHGFTLLLIVGDIVLMIVCTWYDLYLQRTQKKPFHKIMISFSLYTNIKQLTTVKKDPDQLPCIHGIRSMSMIWIILGHQFLFSGIYPHKNYLYTFEWMQEYTSGIITAALFAVDTFLLISGLLVMYVVLLAKANGFKFSIFYYYLHRAFRLTPALIMLILFYMTFLKNFTSGPLWPMLIDIFEKPCRENWWVSVLFLQNTIESRDVCALHTWYLAVDTQLYVIAPLLFIPIKKWPKSTLTAMILLLISSCIYTFVITWQQEISASYLSVGGNFKGVYGSPFVRGNAWFAGGLLGYFLFIKRRKKLVIHKALVALFWFFSCATIIALMYLQVYFNRTPYNKLTASLYHSISKPFWCANMSWIIIACVHGYAGFFNKLLSNRVFVVLGRLTYSMYLVHIVIIYFLMVRIQTEKIFSTANMIHEFWAALIYSIIVSIFWTLCFESPIIAVGKALMPQEMAALLKKINKENENAYQEQTNNTRNFVTRL